MPKYVGPKSEARWNNAARFAEANGAGSRFVRGIYREPRRGVSACEDIQPGSYRAIAGATIAPGESGPILITTCDGTLVENAINQTDCTFYMGNRITANVDPCCVIHFTGCNPSEPVDCCDKSIAVCVNGQRNILKVDGGWAAWARSYDETCCSECEQGWYLRIDLSCAVDTVTATWELWCTAPQGLWTEIGSGTLDWSGLCDDPPVVFDDTLGVTDCDLQIVASPELFVDLCDPCDGSTPPVGCCDKTLWFCINNDSREMAVDGGNETWDVSECCPDCSSATVRLQMTCSNGVISLTRTYNCDGDISIETTNISQYCSSTETAFINIPTSTCFLQAQVSIAEVACDPCVPDPCEDPSDCVSVSCCGTLVPKSLTLTIVGGAFAGTYGMTYDGMLEWVNDTGAFSARMSCSISGWQMSFEMDTYGADDCPPLSFDVTGNGYGITSMVVS